MHLIHAYRRAAVLTVAVVLALGVLALFAACDPSSSNETKAKGASDAEAKEPEADVRADSNPAALHAEGWDCLYVVHAVHCLAPGELPSVTAGTAEEFTVLVFDTMDPESSDAPYLGEEVNIRADLFEGQPCPDDPPSREYTYLPDLGVQLDYYGCHKFDSPL
jgi:hypothetical protein